MGDDEYDDGLSDEMHPLHDAVGKLVLACQGLETWLAIALSMLGGATNFVDAAKRQPTDLIKSLRAIAPGLSNASRDELLTVLTEAEETLDLRNAVVHGSWMTSGVVDSWVATRPSRKARSPEEPWLARRFTRDDLIAAGHRAFGCCGTLQVRSLNWDEELVVQRQT